MLHRFAAQRLIRRAARPFPFGSLTMRQPPDPRPRLSPSLGPALAARLVSALHRRRRLEGRRRQHLVAVLSYRHIIFDTDADALPALLDRWLPLGNG